eukprot:Hpha_TRINITY_DN31737_c0_g1::TRINITY_DN31737_c0_g1_i1::g.116389::m.116389
MPFYYQLGSMPGAVCYMGRDKEENDLLIAHGWPEDVWFHVDGYSSAHVYVRLQKGQGLDALSQDVISECSQLVRNNSIEGCKLPNLKIVYTMWPNLKKTADMSAGQVSFHKRGEVRSFVVEKKDPKVINPLEKTKTWKDVDLRAEQEARMDEDRREKRRLEAEQRQKAKEEMEEAKRKAEERSYAGWGEGTKMTSNQDAAEMEDDFM